MGPGSRGEARRRKNAVFASLSERPLLLLAGVQDPILTETAGSRRPVLSARRGCCWSAREECILGAAGPAFLDNSETSPGFRPMGTPRGGPGYVHEPEKKVNWRRTKRLQRRVPILVGTGMRVYQRGYYTSGPRSTPSLSSGVRCGERRGSGGGLRWRRYDGGW